MNFRLVFVLWIMFNRLVVICRNCDMDMRLSICGWIVIRIFDEVERVDMVRKFSCGG